MTMMQWLPTLWGDERRTDPVGRLHQEIDRMFDDFLAPGRFLGRAGDGVLVPRVDITEVDDRIEIAAELPGVDQKDIEVSIDGDMLTIRGEKKSEIEEKKADHHLVERRFGSFRRSIRLPGEVDPDKVEATFDKGVLKVTFKKPEEAKHSRKRIEVTAA